MAIPRKLKKKLNSTCRRAGLPALFTLSPIGEHIPPIKNPRKPNGHVAFVGTKELGFDNTGKLRPQYYFPSFHWQLTSAHNLSCFYYQSCRDLLRHLNLHKEHNLIVILVYGEDKASGAIPSPDTVQKIRDAHPNCCFYNHPTTGQILRDKRATNLLMSGHGISFPRLIDDDVTTTPVFSNVRYGSNTQTRTIIAGALDKQLYNTEYIDTTIYVDGAPYYCSLRALSAAGILLDFWPRFRPTEKQDASVHTYDVPRDPYLLNHFYKNIAAPLRQRAQDICFQIENTLGLGFYAHDMLYNVEQDKLYVCETGFKFHDYDVPEHLGDLTNSSPWLKQHADSTLVIHAADAIAEVSAGLSNQDSR